MARSAIHLAAAQKYRAKPITIDGEWFASGAEARRYSELQLYAKAGLITNLIRQPTWTLHAGTAAGERIVVGIYRADFAYDDDHGAHVVEDVKGMRTLPLAQWKQKHLQAEYGITVVEVRRR